MGVPRGAVRGRVTLSGMEPYCLLLTLGSKCSRAPISCEIITVDPAEGITSAHRA